MKRLAKPSVSAWAVNQLYWKHQAAFDRLVGAGRKFRDDQTAQLSGKSVDMRMSRDTRRDALNEMSKLAVAILQQAGHSAMPDIMRRIATTLEAISAYATLPDEASLGHLTGDIDPPGFDALAALVPDLKKPAQSTTPAKMPQAPKPSPIHARRELEKAQGVARAAEVALKQATLEARRAEERASSAVAAAQQANERVRALTAEAETAVKNLQEVERRLGTQGIR